MKVSRVVDSEDHITQVAIAGSATRKIESGSILIVVRSGILEHTLPVAVSLVDVTVNQDLKALTPHNGINARYVAWALRASAKHVLRDYRKDGTTVASIDCQRLLEHEVPLAPDLEQVRIADEIESYLSRLDAAVVSLERAEAKLKAYRLSVLKAAVEGRLVPTEAELARAETRDYEPADVLVKRILVERRRRWEEAEVAKMNAAGKPPKDHRWKSKYVEPISPEAGGLENLPEGWTWASAHQLFWAAGYGTSEKCTYEASGSPVLRIPNIVRGRISSDDLKFAVDGNQLDRDASLARDDFLFVRTNGSRSLIGLGARVEQDFPERCYFASYLIRLRLVGLESAADWFAFVWGGPTIRQQILHIAASSAGQHNISLTAVSDFLVPLPPVAEQVRILAEVSRLLSTSDKVATDASLDVQRCVRLREALLKSAFEGKLVDQDPSDEPALRLLERIRAERLSATAAKKSQPRRKARATR